MFGSDVLDVAIGMIFIYLLLSLICSALNEIIEAWLKKRAKDLERGIRELLQDRDGTQIAKGLYQHPLVSGLYRGDYSHNDLDHNAGPWKWLREKLRVTPEAKKSVYRVRGLLLNRKGADLPSYIPSRTFALALMDVLLPGDAAVNSGAAGATIAPPSTPAAPSTNPAPPATPASIAPGAAVGSGRTLKPLRDAILTHPLLSDNEVKNALLPLVDAAGDDASKARDNIEKWFDASMDRVSGWYKRRTQVILLFLGLGAAVVINADSIAIFRSLVSNPPLRQSLAAAAGEYVKNNPSSSPTPAPSPSPDPTSPVEACRTDAYSPECRLGKNVREIKKLGLPIGWDCENQRAVPQCLGPKFMPLSGQWPEFSLWLPKIFGWLLTAAAISLGAPFWFDLLNKFMIVRATVKPREKSPEEKPIG